MRHLAPLSSASTLANPRLPLVGMLYLPPLWHDPRPSDPHPGAGCTLLAHTEQLRLPRLCQAVSPIGPFNQPRPAYILELQIHSWNTLFSFPKFSRPRFVIYPPLIGPPTALRTSYPQLTPTVLPVNSQHIIGVRLLLFSYHNKSSGSILGTSLLSSSTLLLQNVSWVLVRLRSQIYQFVYVMLLFYDLVGLGSDPEGLWMFRSALLMQCTFIACAQ